MRAEYKFFMKIININLPRSKFQIRKTVCNWCTKNKSIIKKLLIKYRMIILKSFQHSRTFLNLKVTSFLLRPVYFKFSRTSNKRFKRNENHNTKFFNFLKDCLAHPLVCYKCDF